MMNFSSPQGQTSKDNNKKPAGGSGYKSRLDEILAKAGNNNPIAAAQSKNANAGQTQPQASAPQAPAQPQDPNDRLQQILAIAGKTTAQKAQAQSQNGRVSGAQNVQAMLQSYLQALSQDPRKVLLCDIEFNCGSGVNDDIYFKCYADGNSNIYWDLFGEDISYAVPQSLSGYGLYDDYYKGIPDSVLQPLMASAVIHSHQVV